MEGVGTVEFSSTEPLQGQLVLKTADGSYAISPRNPDRFIDRLAMELEGAQSAEIKPPSVSPIVAQSALLSDRPAHRLIAAGGLLNLAIMVLLTARVKTELPKLRDRRSTLPAGPAPAPARGISPGPLTPRPPA